LTIDPTDGIDREAAPGGAPARVRVQAFAAIREALGGGEHAVVVQPPATVAMVLERLAEAHPAVTALLPGTAAALNGAIVERSAAVRDGDELALLPPVSGG